MHFAMPPRKSSHPTPYIGRSSRLPLFRRSRLKTVALAALGIGAVIFLFSRLFGSAGEHIPHGTPLVVIVTVMTPMGYSQAYLDGVRQNREGYAKKHGYAAFFPTSNDYHLSGAPLSWSRVPAMRHAMTQFPKSTYFWFLDQNALIMNPDITVERHIMDTSKMETLMIRDRSVVPPNSVIKTFTHLHGNQIDFALTQDREGLSPDSFILRRGDWSKFFLDTWFDPLYRSYNFQKADTHALEHIVQWHPTILSKLALVPQRTMNSYSMDDNEQSRYQSGDFVIHFKGCDRGGGGRNCETEAEVYSKQWRTVFNTR